MRAAIRAAAILGLSAAATAVAGEPPGVAHSGPFTIRYNALAATALPTDAVQHLGLPYSAHQGMINVVVTHGSGYDAPTVPAMVSGHATTAVGGPIPIRFRTIRDANGVSYLGTFKVPGTGDLRFDVDVTPQGGNRRHIHFKQTFLVP